LHASSSGGVKYTDGSIENDLPMQQLSELFNVNHFVVSQVNAHSALLTSMALRTHVWSSPFFAVFVGCVRFLKAQVRDWLKNIVNLLNFSVDRPSYSAKRGMGSFLTQV
jgi:TAG lipase/steryl ester hydrolase/phospholipase A2/LPA acyltransferase